MTKSALITGVTGQDGSYLAELLLSKGYEVHGIKRRASSYNTWRVDHIKDKNFYLHYADLTDTPSLSRLISTIRPCEIYNLGAQSHVAVSFETPEYTANADALGTLRLLTILRDELPVNSFKFYQASTSELFGDNPVVPQNEGTAFMPCSPYAVAKLFSYWTVVNHRQSYGIFASNGILFNHESPRRGPTFVTKKITVGLSRRWLNSDIPPLELGNLNSLRDWGHARDYVEAMWQILQLDNPVDLVLGTGLQITVRDFATRVAQYLGFELEWCGTDANEKAICKKSGRELIKINPLYFRPSEVSNLLADSSKAKKLIGWKPSITLDQLIKEMVAYDLKNAEWGMQSPFLNQVRPA